MPCITFILQLLLALQLQPAPSSTTNPVAITLGASVVPLNGPWKFHTGDDPRWSDPNFDDSDWGAVDLTPAEGSHDADVGLSGYVPGWTMKGHPNYSGFGWYRLRLSIDSLPGEKLALAGPPDVDDAYQLFIDGQLLGGAGDFSRATPVVLSVQPRKFPLPNASPASGTDPREVVVAFRVWMAADSLKGNPDGGGIHIAPLLGTTGAIDARYQVQWLETFRGYVVDAVEPILFVLLAILAWALIPFHPSDSAYRWLAIALVTSALVRANQAFFSWTQLESLKTFALAKEVILRPLGLAAWTMAWRAWFRVERPNWIPRAVTAFCATYIAAQFVLWLASPRTNGLLSALGTLSTFVRLAFAALLVFIIFAGAKRIGIIAGLDVLAALLIATGLFAQELSTLHVPSIWFPFNTGVSRTQFAYAAFVVVLFILLLRRLREFAQRTRVMPPAKDTSMTHG
jgi:hypothetical protein